MGFHSTIETLVSAKHQILLSSSCLITYTKIINLLDIQTRETTEENGEHFSNQNNRWRFPSLTATSTPIPTHSYQTVSLQEH
jgi:hypothetical protein